MWRLSFLLICAAGLFLPSVGRPADSALSNTNQIPMASQSMQGQQSMMGAAPEMKEMSNSMKAMSDMCQMMMQREMAARPWKIAVLASVGTLGLLALALFVMLEIQWIRFWSLRVRTERLKLP